MTRCSAATARFLMRRSGGILSCVLGDTVRLTRRCVCIWASTSYQHVTLGRTRARAPRAMASSRPSHSRRPTSIGERRAWRRQRRRGERPLPHRYSDRHGFGHRRHRRLSSSCSPVWPIIIRFSIMPPVSTFFWQAAKSVPRTSSPNPLPVRDARVVIAGASLGVLRALITHDEARAFSSSCSSRLRWRARHGRVRFLLAVGAELVMGQVEPDDAGIDPEPSSQRDRTLELGCHSRRCSDRSACYSS